MGRPSAEQLAAEAVELCEKLGFDKPNTDIDYADLGTLVADLRAKAADADNDTDADQQEAKSKKQATTEKLQAARETAQAAEAERKAKSAETAPYYVCDGKAITTYRGVMGEGRGVHVKDVNGGKETLERLAKKGYLRKADA